MLRNIMMLGAWAAALAPMSSAHAADEIRFVVSTGPNIGDRANFFCRGPWRRKRTCANFARDTREAPFYEADDNLFSPFHQDWTCGVYDTGDEDCRGPARVNVTFCLETSKVILQYDAEKRVITANQPGPGCVGIAPITRSVLGFGGEDDASPAQDTDTYSFEGKPGQKVEIRLGRDGSSGSAGEVAALRVRAANGAVLGQRTGAVPLSLDVTLPGTVEVAVSRQPGNGDPLRGYYELEVIAKSGDIGERKLRPSADVEQ